MKESGLISTQQYRQDQRHLRSLALVSFAIDQSESLEVIGCGSHKS